MPFREELIAELKFVTKCEGNTKTVRCRKSDSVESRQSVRSDHSNNSGGNGSNNKDILNLKYLDRS